MKRKKRIGILIGTLVILVCFTVMLSHFLYKKTYEAKKKNPFQYDLAYSEYLIQFLEKSDEAKWKETVDKEAAIAESIDDSYYTELYQQFVLQREEMGFQILDVSIIEVRDDEITVLMDSNFEKEIAKLSIQKNELSNIMKPLDISQTDMIQSGTIYHALVKDGSIVLMLKKLANEVVLPKTFIIRNDDVFAFQYNKEVFERDKADLDFSYNGYEDLADLVLSDGKIINVEVYQKKMHGKLMSVEPTELGYEIELDDGTLLSADENIPIYNLVSDTQSAEISDLTVGYDFTDFVLDQNQNCVACLIARTDSMENIRVALRTTNHEKLYHDTVCVTCDTDFDLVEGEKVTTMNAGDLIEDTKQWYTTKRIKIIPKAYTGRILLSSIERSQGTPSYRGVLEIEKTSQGYVLINELPLDEYLYSVVPSEMPSSYPQDALCAQAVSARTYAYSHMLHSNMQKYGAHVDDSASFQVYNNMEETLATTDACRKTAGEILYYQDQIATTYFYSTSCGYGTDMTAWTCKDIIDKKDLYLKADYIAKEESKEQEADILQQEEDFRLFITRCPEECYEKEDSYFRWKYKTSFEEELFWTNLQNRYDASKDYVLTKTENGFESLPIDDQGKIKSLEVIKRAPGGAAIELLVTGEHHTYKIMTEKNIRYLMANEETTISLGSEYDKESHISTMVPSAFFVCDVDMGDDGYVEGYTLFGGGFGHGIGMSQNGAKGMAKAGLNYRDILAFYYRDTTIQKVNE